MEKSLPTHGQVMDWCPLIPDMENALFCELKLYLLFTDESRFFFSDSRLYLLLRLQASTYVKDAGSSIFQRKTCSP